jgi:hypothetical protein
MNGLLMPEKVNRIKMTNQQLWKYILEKKIALAHPFDRDFVWISKRDFEPIKKYFFKERNFIQKGNCYRTRAFFKHIHAVEQEEIIFFHFDFGNHTRFLPLALVHFFADVFPYFVFCLMKRRTMEEFFVPPNLP